jgi:hypothetical protein
MGFPDTVGASTSETCLETDAVNEGIPLAHGEQARTDRRQTTPSSLTSFTDFPRMITTLGIEVLRDAIYFCLSAVSTANTSRCLANQPPSRAAPIAA